MNVDVTPAAAHPEHRALVIALERTDVRPSGQLLYESTWRLAGLREAADDEGARYVLSPRRTRGATRA